MSFFCCCCFSCTWQLFYSLSYLSWSLKVPRYGKNPKLFGFLQKLEKVCNDLVSKSYMVVFNLFWQFWTLMTIFLKYFIIHIGYMHCHLKWYHFEISVSSLLYSLNIIILKDFFFFFLAIVGKFWYFSKNRLLGRFFQRVALSVFLSDTICLLFVWRFVKYLAIPEYIREQPFGGSLNMHTKYCVTKSEGKKTLHFSKICPRELSFQTIHLYKNPAYGRHWIFRSMRIVATIPQ